MIATTELMVDYVLAIKQLYGTYGVASRSNSIGTIAQESNSNTVTYAQGMNES